MGVDHVEHRPPLPPASLTFPTAQPDAAESTVTYAGGPAGASSGEPAPPVAVNGYRLFGVIGKGGMGTVWKAVQLSTQREVALKMLDVALLGSEKARSRFEQEVELAASLEHPHIARVYDSGLSQGAYYYAMELISGERLDDYVRSHKLSRRSVTRLMSTVCRAVQFAHQRTIVHRDIKPSNVLVTRDGEPKVLDFGLARLAGAAGARETLAGEVVGTPAFMAPEQARGESDVLDTRTDVYALGATLYLLLVGTTPHDTEGTLPKVLKRIAEQPPRPPRSMCPDLDVELETVLQKALDPTPDARYASAGELAADLDRYLEGRPLAARPHTKWYVLRKWLARNRRAVAVGAAAAVLIGAGALFSIYSRVREHDARMLATERTRMTISLLNELVFDVQREMGRDPVSLAVRRKLLDRAANRLQSLGDAGGDEFKPSIDRASADVLAQMEQYFDDAGRGVDAELAYRRAAGFLERQARGGERPRAALDLLVVQSRLARLYLARRDTGSARRLFDQASTWLGRLSSDPDYSGQSPAVLAHNRWALLTTSANLLSAEGKTVEALAAGSDAWDLARAMRRDGNRFLTDEDCAVTLTALAACHVERFKVDKDPAHLRSALEHLEAAAAIDRARLPVGGPHAHFDLAAVLYAQGDAHLRGGDPARAAAALRDALAHLDEALAGEPERADWREQKQRIETLLASLGREADPALNPKSGSD